MDKDTVSLGIVLWRGKGKIYRKTRRDLGYRLGRILGLALFLQDLLERERSEDVATSAVELGLELDPEDGLTLYWGRGTYQWRRRAWRKADSPSMSTRMPTDREKKTKKRA